MENKYFGFTISDLIYLRTLFDELKIDSGKKFYEDISKNGIPPFRDRQIAFYEAKLKKLKES